MEAPYFISAQSFLNLTREKIYTSVVDSGIHKQY